MLGKVSKQRALFDVGNVYDLELPAKSFHAQLANARGNLFSDDDFIRCYSATMGRPSVPPSLLALMLILQSYEGVSDEEAIARSAFDLRWVAVLGRTPGKPMCAKSTLQLFRAHLILHQDTKLVFKASIQEAKRNGLINKSVIVAIDTKPVIGRGAVKDTYNLLSDGIVQLGRQLAKEAGQKVDAYLTDVGMEQHAGSSIKGEADIDWSNEQAQQSLLEKIVSDARKLLDRALGGSQEVREFAELLCSLLRQDIEEKPSEGDGSPSVNIMNGTPPGRISSTTDPEQRHGRKSASKRFTGSKASIAVDVESQIILDAEILSGDAPDNEGALKIVKAVEANSGVTVEETLGDCAYGDGNTRQEFANADRALTAKVPKNTSREGQFPKRDFQIDLENNTVTCPGGQTATNPREEKDGGKTFSFGAACADCPLRALCTTSTKGRTIRVHPQEPLLQSARALQQTTEGRERLRKRVAVEHALARLSHLGIGQARYFSRQKTKFQLLTACAVANLRLIWNRLSGSLGSTAQVTVS